MSSDCAALALAWVRDEGEFDLSLVSLPVFVLILSLLLAASFFLPFPLSYLFQARDLVSVYIRPVCIQCPLFPEPFLLDLDPT